MMVDAEELEEVAVMLPEDKIQVRRKKVLSKDVVPGTVCLVFQGVPRDLLLLRPGRGRDHHQRGAGTGHEDFRMEPVGGGPPGKSISPSLSLSLSLSLWIMENRNGLMHREWSAFTIVSGVARACVRSGFPVTLCTGRPYWSQSTIWH